MREDTETEKSRKFLTEIIFLYHDEFKNNPTIQEFALRNPKAFDTNYLVEQCVGYVGNIKQDVPKDYEDHSDGSDTKTSSFRIVHEERKVPDYKFTVHSVKSQAGNIKNGALRLVVHNKYADEIYYYYLPKSFWIKKVRKGRSLNFFYNTKNQECEALKDFMCKDFFELATKKDVDISVSV